MKKLFLFLALCASLISTAQSETPSELQSYFPYIEMSAWTPGMQFVVNERTSSKVKLYHKRGKGKELNSKDFVGKIFKYLRMEDRYPYTNVGVFECEGNEYEFKIFTDRVDGLLYYDDYKKAKSLFEGKTVYYKSQDGYAAIMTDSISLNDFTSVAKLHYKNAQGDTKDLELVLSGTNSLRGQKSTDKKIAEFNRNTIISEKEYQDHLEEIKKKEEEKKRKDEEEKAARIAAAEAAEKAVLDNACNDIKSGTDSLDGKPYKTSPVSDDIIFQKKKDGVYIALFDNVPVSAYNKPKGLSIILKNGTKINRPNCEIVIMDAARGYLFGTTFKLTDEEVKKMLASPIAGYKFYIFDYSQENEHDQKMWLRYLECLTSVK